jgi:hypothetical protein
MVSALVRAFCVAQLFWLMSRANGANRANGAMPQNNFLP